MVTTIKKKKVQVAGVDLNSNKLFLMAGPCAIEERDMMLRTAEKIKDIADRKSVTLIFKSSFEKDNRSSLQTFQGVGLDAGLKILQEIKQTFSIPIVTDIHRSEQAAVVAEVADVLQIPAFLCMQTSLLMAAAKTGLPVNIKHGQFLSPANMLFSINKCEAAGNHQLILTERGYCFGYNDLIVDPRSFYELRQFGYPVVFDITHAIRRYGDPSMLQGTAARQYIPLLSRVGAAAGINGVFLEVHPQPDQAKCDVASQLDLSDLEGVLGMILEFHNLAQQYLEN